MPVERPLPPSPTGGTSCDWGGDSTPATGWRWSKSLRAWLPVCDRHHGGKLTMTAGDFVPDWANVPRAEG